MKRLASAVLLLVSLTLAGCAIAPPPHTPAAQFCRFHMYRLAVPLTDIAPGGPSADQGPTLATQIESALRERTAPAAQPQTVLALSGGSQHGAFGAGFLDGWRRSRPGERLPEFDVVTGISTGSILATFAFLGDTDRPVTRYRIRNERELLTPIMRSRRDGSMSPVELIRVVRRGAVADLAPLRDVLLGDGTRPGEISPEVMRQVAQARDRHRRLYVGAVDLDSGQAVAMDLTQMAWEYVNAAPADAAETADQHRLRACYVEAIIASSSAPLAARPVFIDNGMYVDGGVRFGMFADDVITGAGRAGKVNGRTTEFYVIANGHLETSAECGRADEARCTANPPSGRPTDPRGRWSLLNLAVRSEDVLVNQVYRFSADRIIGERKLGNGVWFARIDRAGLDAHLFRMDDPTLDTLTPAGRRHSCAAWREEDRVRLHPIQFYPRYMHCMIDYGQRRGREGLWDIPSRADPVAVAAPKP
jgi:predicted acylesterase/phospholipase RssA